MSRKEVPRAGLVKAALAGRITNEQGARALHMTVRQFQRVKKRFREHGARGLLHALGQLEGCSSGTSSGTVRGGTSRIVGDDV